MRPWILAEVNYAYVKEHPYEVAVLPLGATEPHNLHLPYGTDTLEGETVGEAICRAAHEQGASVVLLPTMPYGTETNQRAFPLAMNVNPSSLFAVMTDLVESLAHHGVRKIVLLNSHGGNDMKALIARAVWPHAGACVPVQLVHGAIGLYHEIFEHGDDHAGEMETSFALAYFPHLVSRNKDGTLAADAGAVRSTRFDAVNRGWVSITRPWHLLTTNSGAGNPHKATADKAKRLMELLVPRLAKFLVELSNSPLDERFPF